MSGTPHTRFTDLLAELLHAAWGGADPRRLDYVSSHVEIFPKPQLHSRDVVVAVLFKEHTREIDKCRFVLPERDFIEAVRVDDLDLRHAEDTEDVFVAAFRVAVGRFRGAFYEYDPRIGIVAPDPDKPHLPECPLFDPPVRFPPLWASVDPLRNPQPESVACPICEEPYSVSNPPMWGGGNLGWVHTHCYVRDLPVREGVLLNTVIA